jgi:hypothetical protein
LHGVDADPAEIRSASMRWMTASVMAWSSAERGAVTYVGEPISRPLPGCANTGADGRLLRTTG